MTEKDIEKSLSSNYVNKGKFNNLSVKNLLEIMAYLEKYLKSDKGNWEINQYFNYGTTHNIPIHHLTDNLKQFLIVYSARTKRKALTFKRYFQTCENKIKTRSYSNDTYSPSYFITRSNIKIKEKKKTKEFIRQLKKLFDDYLEGSSHDKWRNHIIKFIDLGLSPSTIRKIYFDNQL